ncbi:site-specific integrase [Planosporangium sp. 12N6]|uniref:site-specific integrase n=1 Tax=Planosporangium spinosum TaxID=3402278 RepID=UPI003CE7FE85
MRPNPHRGRVYRRCACRDHTTGKQLGARCPRLIANPRHGSWGFAVDLPSLSGRRATMRRGGFPTRSDARAALARVLDCERTGVYLDDRETVASYLGRWLQEKARTLKPTTMARYTDYVTKDLAPALGAIKLERLSHQHIGQFVRDQLAVGRGPVTLRRCIATLSSALNDAVRQRRLPHNPARYTALPKPPKVERPCWTTAEAAQFLRHCRTVDDPLADLFELLIATGLRKGEALALRWADVDLDQGMLFIRHTLAAVDNAHLIFTDPKTRGSRAWVALSARAIAALHRQTARQHRQWPTLTVPEPERLVFSRPDGRPLRPEYVLRHFRRLTTDARLPRIRVHDLRHAAATIMITSGVPLAVVSKTLRHSTLSVTVNIYGHLTRQAAHDAVEATATALDTATLHAGQPPMPAPPAPRRATTPRPRPDNRHGPGHRRPTSRPHHRPGTRARTRHGATTLRPPRPETQPADTPAKAYPLVTTVGTAGFEPTTP